MIDPVEVFNTKPVGKAGLTEQATVAPVTVEAELEIVTDVPKCTYPIFQ